MKGTELPQGPPAGKAMLATTVRDTAVPNNKRMYPKGSYGLLLTWG